MSGDDIYIDTSDPTQVKFTWVASNAVDNSPVNFSVVLFNTGAIRFDYGPGNTNLSPTIGLSSGNGQSYVYAPNNHQSTLTNAHSVLFNFAPGVADLGGTNSAARPATSPPRTSPHRRQPSCIPAEARLDQPVAAQLQQAA